MSLRFRSLFRQQERVCCLFKEFRGVVQLFLKIDSERNVTLCLGFRTRSTETDRQCCQGERVAISQRQQGRLGKASVFITHDYRGFSIY